MGGNEEDVTVGRSRKGRPDVSTYGQKYFGTVKQKPLVLHFDLTQLYYLLIRRYFLLFVHLTQLYTFIHTLYHDLPLFMLWVIKRVYLMLR